MLLSSPPAEAPMNITVNIDISPDEMRKLMGLPDVESFQQ